MSGGDNFVILEDGSLWGWGWNRSGVLREDGERLDEPVHILDNVVSAEVNEGAAWVIRTDGSLWAWVGRNRPSHIMNDVVYVDRDMALKIDGSLWWWGFDGMLRHIMDDVASFSGGWGHIMTIRTDGSLWGWGSNWYGQIGDGTTECHESPMHIMDDVIAVSAGGFHTAAITSDGVLWTWGSNVTGKIGDGTVTRIGPGWEITEDNTRLYPTRIMDNVVTVSTSGPPVTGNSGNTLVIRGDGSLWGWGFGMNSGSIPYHFNTWGWFNPVPGKILDDAAHIVRSIESAVAISSNGDLWDLTNGGTFVANNVFAVSYDWNNKLVLYTDGNLWHWERNIYSIPDEYMVFEWHNPTFVMDGVLLP